MTLAIIVFIVKIIILGGIDSTTGVKASTTRNIIGVYDMSGRAWERTMSVYNNLVSGSRFIIEAFNKLPSSHITKYTTEIANLLKKWWNEL